VSQAAWLTLSWQVFRQQPSAKEAAIVVQNLKYDSQQQPLLPGIVHSLLKPKRA
jgi:hypothetical protein